MNKQIDVAIIGLGGMGKYRQKGILTFCKGIEREKLAGSITAIITKTGSFSF